jgi:uncharacterized protein (TIGR03435 family)
MSRAAFAFVLITFSYGQVPAPTFEAAAMRAASPDGRNGALVNFIPGGGLRATNTTLKDLIETGYQVRGFQILDGPSWAGATRYDVTASSGPQPQGTSNNEVRLKVRALLKDRFQLQVHRETRTVPVYSLVLAKNAGKEGGLRATLAAARGVNASPGTMLGEAAPMTALASKLSIQLDRPVVNNTGLEGNYDFKLQWTPDPGPPALDGRVAEDSPGPSLFTALQEQLGLRVESAKGPVEVLVIDHAERPSDN